MITLNYENKDQTYCIKFKHENSLDYLVIKLQEFISLVEGETVFLDAKYPWEYQEPISKKKNKKDKNK